jgi:hypothetical protein
MSGYILRFSKIAFATMSALFYSIFTPKSISEDRALNSVPNSLINALIKIILSWLKNQISKSRKIVRVSSSDF